MYVKNFSEYEDSYDITNFYESIKHNWYHMKESKIFPLSNMKDDLNIVDIIIRILVYNANNRITYEEILKHDFLSKPPKKSLKL